MCRGRSAVRFGHFWPLRSRHAWLVDLMITVNLDVGNTLTTGTQGKVKQVILKPNQQPHEKRIDAHTVNLS